MMQERTGAFCTSDAVTGRTGCPSTGGLRGGGEPPRRPNVSSFSEAASSVAAPAVLRAVPIFKQYSS